MGIAISQVLASLEPCFYARFIVRMALRRSTETDIPLMVNFTENGYAHLPQRYLFYSHRPYFIFENQPTISKDQYQVMELENM